MESAARSLGDCIRDARVRKKKSLRQLAKDLDVTPSYLSDIENNRRVPAEAVLSKVAQELGLDLDELMGIAGRLGEKAERYVRNQPTAVRLFRRIAEANLDNEQLNKLISKVEITETQKQE